MKAYRVFIDIHNYVLEPDTDNLEDFFLWLLENLINETSIQLKDVNRNQEKFLIIYITD